MRRFEGTSGPERPDFDLVVMGASLGGLAAYRQILAELPADFPAPIVLVQHTAPGHPSLLADLLSRVTPLRVQQAEPGGPLRPGTVYTSVRDYHLRVRPDRTSELSRSSRVHFLRPAADVLFASAAEALGERVIAAVLTGGGWDGAAGVRAVRQAGGYVIAQDERSATCPEMPYHAVLTRKVDVVLPLVQIAFALRTLVGAGEAAPV